MDSSSMDLSHLWTQVPLWFVGLSLIKWWFHKNQKDQEEVMKRLAKIEITLASMNIPYLVKNVETLRESRIKQDAKMDELYRALSRIPNSIRES